MRVQEYADIVNTHEKSKVVMDTNRMGARALCSVDIAIVDGNSIGGHVMETSA